MAPIIDLTQLTFFLPTLIILLQNVVDAIVDIEDGLTFADDNPHAAISIAHVHKSVVDTNTMIVSVLHDFRIAHVNSILENGLG